MVMGTELYEIEKKYGEHYFAHTYYVVLAWKLIRRVLLDKKTISEREYKIINHLVAWHDNSKISELEFKPYALGLYSQDKDTKEVHDDFKEAINIHKSSNLHHFESLKNYKGNDWKCYIIELICDYIAMGWEFKNYLLEYYQANKESIELPKEYKEYLEYVISIIKDTCYDEVERPMDCELEMKLFYKE